MINILTAKNNQERTIYSIPRPETLHFWLKVNINEYIFYKVEL